VELVDLIIVLLDMQIVMDLFKMGVKEKYGLIKIVQTVMILAQMVKFVHQTINVAIFISS